MKKKMRAFAFATATVLAFMPFLGGCAAAEDAGGQNGEAQQELAYDEQQRNEDMGSIGQGVQGEDVRYGQVMALNGNQATVVVGELADAADGSKAFSSGQDEITFDVTEVQVADGRQLSADDIVVMQGTGEGSSFKPETVEVMDVAAAGTNADDAQIPQGAK
ncbi:hypothetical protein [Arabiibacter massiliensis]|uniref:hypothetical protein n=1 Tax=Arabiibacter massiliensis TaxID=1870985 RepID=UPI0009B970C9|nr:hypothetical protein [Arabiibacter massiliensis]